MAAYIWGNWNRTSTTGATSSSSITMGDAIYSSWCDDATTTMAGAGPHQTWRIWANNGTATGDTSWVGWSASAGCTIKYQSPQLTPEQRAEQEQKAREYQELAAKAERERQAAEKRANVLLRRNLAREQRAEMKKRNCFYLRGPSGRRYKIDASQTHGNIAVVDDNDNIIETLCVQPGNVPLSDAILAQKLYLEHDEETIRKTANITPRRATG